MKFGFLAFTIVFIGPINPFMYTPKVCSLKVSWIIFACSASLLAEYKLHNWNYNFPPGWCKNLHLSHCTFWSNLTSAVRLKLSDAPQMRQLNTSLYISLNWKIEIQHSTKSNYFSFWWITIHNLTEVKILKNTMQQIVHYSTFPNNNI